MEKNVRDLEDVRVSEDYSKHPQGCICGKCGHDHEHVHGRVPLHTHGDASLEQAKSKAGFEHEHSHEEAADSKDICVCGQARHCPKHEHSLESVAEHNENCSF